VARPAWPGRAGPQVEVADVLRDHAGELTLSCEQRRAVRAIAACRTAALGGHLQTCGHCGYTRPVYNSCRNRHCPKCQVLKQALWAEGQERRLLPVGYFHLVFTVPSELHPLFRHEARRCFGLLFAAVSETLLEVARRRLGVKIGFTAVLHTWTQRLLFHPHLHCIVVGGGLSDDGTRWVGCRDNYFVPVRVLRLVFRGKLLSKLEAALRSGGLAYPQRPGQELLAKAARQAWVVYAKRPMAGAAQVVRYFSRYTHRIVLSNSRLVSYDGSEVTFAWRDRSDGNRRKNLKLTGREFARRFLWHVLPRGFVRIRHYGLLGNRTRGKDLQRCRELLDAGQGVPALVVGSQSDDWVNVYQRIFGTDPLLCPACGEGRLTPGPALLRAERSPRAPPSEGRRP
jgi:hypothetical protein